MAEHTDASVCWASRFSILPCLMKPEHCTALWQKCVLSVCQFHSLVSGTEILICAPGRNFYIFIFLWNSLPWDRGQTEDQTCLVFQRPLQKWFSGAIELLKPEADFLRQLITLPSGLSHTACARCLSKQNLRAQFPDHSSQTAEGWRPHFFFGIPSFLFMWLDVFLE